MAIKHTEDFKQEAVRIALTSGLPRRRVASDLGVGFSTLSKWVSQYRPSDLTAQPQGDLARENERLRLENCILKEERDILKKAQSALGNSSRANACEVWLYQRVAAYLVSGVAMQRHAVTPRGFRKWPTRPMSNRQRGDMTVQAHIREQYGLSLGSLVYPERPPCGQSKGASSHDDRVEGSGP